MTNKEKDERYMRLAIAEANIAEQHGDVPVGAVLVCRDQVIAHAHNNREQEKTVLGHAEINVIQTAEQLLNRRHLNDCTLYVTLEPCMMCTGAIVQARIGRVVFSLADPKGGCFVSLFNLDHIVQLNHHPKWEQGVLEQETQPMLTAFFKAKRQLRPECFIATDVADRSACQALRNQVFVQEQGVPESLEIDEADKTARYFAIRKGSEVVATLRIIGDGDTVTLGRFAVAKSQRGKHLGRKLILFTEQVLRTSGVKKIQLHAQIQVVDFYQKYGYKKVSEPFEEAGIMHVTMERKLRTRTR